MSWYKKAHKDWKDFLNNLHIEKEKVRKEASEKAKKLEHFLDGWTPINSCYCRKCGAYAKINGFYGTDEKITFYGDAFTNKCRVSFDNAPNFKEYSNPNPTNAVL